MINKFKYVLYLVIFLASFQFAFASELNGVISNELIVMVSPISSLKEGTYSNSQTAILSASGSNNIHYSIDGSVPKCTDSSLYKNPLNIDKTMTLKAISCYSNENGLISSFDYKIENRKGGGGSRGSYIGNNLPISAKGEVLGEFTCKNYLNSKMSMGKQNNAGDVKKLQTFLNKEMLSNLPISGFFGKLTKGVVIDFQNKYKDEILGNYKATGNVYEATLKKINEIECAHASSSVSNIR